MLSQKKGCLDDKHFAIRGLLRPEAPGHDLPMTVGSKPFDKALAATYSDILTQCRLYHMDS